MRKLLVADDEPDMLQTLENLLDISFSECQILTASDGQQALEVAVREKPSVILADFKMPRLDGFELARRLEHAGGGTPILLMTAFADSNLEAKAAAFPLIRHFFKKPIDPPALIRAIRDVLDEGETGRSEPASATPPGQGGS